MVSMNDFRVLGTKMMRHPLAPFLPYFLVALSVIPWAFVQIWSGERIPVNGGVGWDASRFVRVISDFPEELPKKPLDKYDSQRLLPGFLVYLGLRASGIPPPFSDTDIINAFLVFNIILFWVDIVLWVCIGKCLRLDSNRLWIGLCSLLFNFPFLKLQYYYPITWDTSAFTLSLGMVLALVRRDNLFLLLLSLIGAFTWPTLLVFGLGLFVLSYGEKARNSRLKLTFSPAGATFLSVLTGMVYIFLAFHFRYSYQAPVGTSQNLFVVSVLFAAVYIFACCRFLYQISVPFPVLTKKTVMGVFIAFISFLAVRLLLEIISRPGPQIQTTELYFKQLILLPVSKPVIFVVAHITYFGPILGLAVFCGKHMCQAISVHPAFKYTGVFILYVMAGFSLDSESRRLIPFWPFFVTFLMVSLPPIQVSKSRLFLLTALCVFLSRCWFPINMFPFPNCYYYSVFGPWMENKTYLLNVIIAIISTTLVYVLVRPRTVFTLWKSSQKKIG